MATYDLEQQEQLDQYKQIWKQYGSLAMTVLLIGLLTFAGWKWYLRQQNENALKAASLYEALDSRVSNGDLKRMATVFQDMKAKYPNTTYTAQAALLMAQVQAEQGKDEDARSSLTWLVDNTKNQELGAIARLRLAGLLLDAKQYPLALKQLEQGISEEFIPLANDRKGDILFAQGKKQEAITAYQKAFQLLDKSMEYRRIVENKLIALGAAPPPEAASKIASGA